MILIKEKYSNAAWRNTLKQLYSSQLETDNDKYYKDEPTLIEIENPVYQIPDELFPMNSDDLKIINEYIVSGRNEDKVIHEWTKIYYHRIFDQPNSQFDFFIEKLKVGIPVGEAQISMWDKRVDQNAAISPCTQIIWGRIKQGKLEIHVHAHSSDAYKKLLMNIQEFISFQNFVAQRLNIPVGKYFHFIDSCHIHKKDILAVQKIIPKL
jgi:thymidylate synthase